METQNTAAAEAQVRPNNPKDELIAKLVKKEVSLSYSSLKNFTSPMNFINYKLKPFKRTPSMVFGLLCDMLLLTPDDLDKEFVITDNIPTTDKQHDFCDEVIEFVKAGGDLDEKVDFEILVKKEHQRIVIPMIDRIWRKHYSRGKYQDTYEPLKAYIDAMIDKKVVVDRSTYDEAKELTDALLANPEVQMLFSQIEAVQKKLEWEYRGWKCKAILDILMSSRIVDLKFTKDATPDKFERDMYNLQYFLQAGMYCYGAEKLGLSENMKYSILAYEKSGNFSIITLSADYIMYGIKMFKYLVQQLERCIDESAFDRSYGFNYGDEVLVYKPRWAKGFELTEDD